MKLFQPQDDHRFAAVLLLGPVVSSPASTYVKVIDATEEFCFAMNLLQASLVEHRFPVFATTGLLGYWKLSNGFLVLDADIETADVKSVLVSDENPDWIREHYIRAFSHM